MLQLIAKRIFNLNYFEIEDVLTKAELLTLKNFFILFVYYIFAIINALFEGVGLVLIVELFVNNDVSGENIIYEIIQNSLGYFDILISEQIIILIISLLFLLKFLFYGSLLTADAYMSANIRKRLQQVIYKRLIFSNWEDFRNISIGEAVNNNVAETLGLEKFLTSIIRLIYFSFTCTIYLSLALIISWKITIILILIVLPFFIIMQLVLRKQSKTSIIYAQQRNNFATNITERLNGLLHIKGESSEEYHLNKGFQMQKPMRKSAVIVGIMQASVTVMVSILPFIVFFLFFIWALLSNQNISDYTFLIASVGIVGVRSMTQFNGFVGQFSQVSRLSGSLNSIYKILNINQAILKKAVNEKIHKIKVENISYNYGDNIIINNLSFEIKKNAPVVIQGPSGTGKSTIANIISGLLKPITGKIEFFSTSGNVYNAELNKIKAGYVTQDIYLFSGTFLSNLIGDNNIKLDRVNHILEVTDSKNFIERAGGLNAKLLESGKSLSGGQKRRLGIARALLLDSDLIILDEIFAGLDSKNKSKIVRLVNEISKENLIISISHEDTSIDNSVTIKI